MKRQVVFAKSVLAEAIRARKRSFVALLASAPFYIVLIGTLLSITTAYQRRERYRIEVGGNPLLDMPYVGDIHTPEVGTSDNRPFTFRWTERATTIFLPGLGSAGYDVRLTLSPGPNPASSYDLIVNGTALGPVPLEPELHTYHLMVPARLVPQGDLHLQLVVEPVIAPGDRRELGVALSRVEAAPVSRAWIIPPLHQVGWLWTAVLLVMLFCGYVGCSPRMAAGAGALWALGETYVIAFERLWLTPISASLCLVLLGAILLVVVLDPLFSLLWADRGWMAQDQRRATFGSYPQLLVLLGAAFVVYLAGMLHPQIQIYDIGFHANRIADLWVAGNYFTRTGSAEWGGRATFYPLFTYMFMGPLRLFFRDPYVVIKVFIALSDVVRLFAVYLVVRWSTNDARAAGLAAFFLAVFPISVLPHQWGIASNLFGETLAALLLVILVAGYGSLRRRPVLGLLTAVLTLALVSHPGAILLSGVVTCMVIVLWWANRHTRRQSYILAVSFALAAVGAFGLYHWKTVGEMIPQAQQTLRSQFGGGEAKPEPAGVVCRQDRTAAALKMQVGGSVIDPELGLEPRCVYSWSQVVTEGTKGLLAEAIAYFRLIPLLTVPIALWWLWRGTTAATGATASRKRVLLLCLIAWLTTAALFALVGLTINLYVRYSLFLAPVLAICTAIVAARLWALHWWGKLAVWGVMLYFGVGGLALWYTRITYSGH